MGASIKGSRELRAKIARVRAGLANGSIVARAAERWEPAYISEVTQHTPDPVTGTLDNSFAIKSAGNVVRITNSAPYSGFLNDGTRYIEPRYFAQAALLVTRALLIALVKEEIRKELR